MSIINFPRNFTIHLSNRSIESYNHFRLWSRIIIYQMVFNNVIISSSMMVYEDMKMVNVDAAAHISNYCYRSCYKHFVLLPVFLHSSKYIHAQCTLSMRSISSITVSKRNEIAVMQNVCTKYIESNHVPQFGSYLWPM